MCVALSAKNAAAKKAVGPEGEEIPPEVLAVIAAAATAFLGRNFRLRSVELQSPQESVSRWSRQGRAFVQASHNLRKKR
jgi:hypothetical protein